MPQEKYLAGGLQSGCTANSTGVQYTYSEIDFHIPTFQPRTASCPTLSLWKGPDRDINDYLDHITIADLVRQENSGEDSFRFL